VWEFPSGGTANYRHCQHDKNAKDYDGWEINFLGFDELTHFTRRQYLALCARVRSAKPGLPTIIRATSNPGGDGHEWVFERWGAWLNPEFEAEGLERRFDSEGRRAPPARPGEVLWVRRVRGAEVYSREDTGQGALSRTFIPALARDNPHLTKNDPDYLAQLEELDPVTKQQLLYGDWLVRPAAGKYFKRTWVEFVDAPPADTLKRFRAWDLAGTEKKDSKSDPDWTVGGRFSIDRDGHFYVEDIVRTQGNPGEVKRLIQATAEMDGVGTSIFLPQDPGQAGKYQVTDMRKALFGFIVKSTPVTGDKLSRFGPFSSYAQGGLVRIVRGKWNEAYIAELESFPEGAKDDQVDVTSDGFRMVGNVNRMVLAFAKTK
jgi:predicted phage terminase large subunit-like protein